jgi:hypothetical protein
LIIRREEEMKKLLVFLVALVVVLTAGSGWAFTISDVSAYREVGAYAEVSLGELVDGPYTQTFSTAALGDFFEYPSAIAFIDGVAEAAESAAQETTISVTTASLSVSGSLSNYTLKETFVDGAVAKTNDPAVNSGFLNFTIDTPGLFSFVLENFDGAEHSFMLNNAPLSVGNGQQLAAGIHQFSYWVGANTSDYFSFDVTGVPSSVPEPALLSLLGLGLATLGGLRMRIKG